MNKEIGSGISTQMGNVEVAKLDNCVGCFTCEIICSFVHENEFKPTSSRIRVNKNGLTDATCTEISECDLCNGNVECVRWCPAGVLRYARKGSHNV